MHHRLRRAAALLLCVIAVAVPVMLAPSANAKVSLPLKGLVTTKADDNSLNWVGYYQAAGQGDQITQVSSTMVTPKPKLLPPFLSASWVGIGGASTNDLIQAGVAYQSTPADYYVWYEMLPAGLIPIRTGCVGDANCTVVVGDKINVDIRLVGADTWKISFTNVGKWTYALTTPYASSLSSADFIFEAPARGVLGQAVYGLPAANDSIKFYDNTYTVNGQQKSLTQAGATKSNLSPIGIISLAVPSAINANTSAFAVCPYRQSCAGI